MGTRGAANRGLPSAARDGRSSSGSSGGTASEDFSAFIDEGVPSSAVFAAAFCSEQPVAPNVDAKNRARNRRVEMAPVPRTTNGGSKPHD